MSFAEISILTPHAPTAHAFKRARARRATALATSCTKIPANAGVFSAQNLDVVTTRG
jgi:hypothetical protein